MLISGVNKLLEAEYMNWYLHSVRRERFQENFEFFVEFFHTSMSFKIFKTVFFSENYSLYLRTVQTIR